MTDISKSTVTPSLFTKTPKSFICDGPTFILSYKKLPTVSHDNKVCGIYQNMGNKYYILAVWLASWFGMEFEGRVGVVMAPQSCTCATRSTNQHSAQLGQIVGE